MEGEIIRSESWDSDMVEEDNPMVNSSQFKSERDKEAINQELQISFEDEDRSIEIIDDQPPIPKDALFTINENPDEEKPDFLSRNLSFANPLQTDIKSLSGKFIAEFLAFKFRYKQKLAYIARQHKEMFQRCSEEKATNRIHNFILRTISASRWKAKETKHDLNLFHQYNHNSHLKNIIRKNLKWRLTKGHPVFDNRYLSYLIHQKPYKCLNEVTSVAPLPLTQETPSFIPEHLRLIHKRLEEVETPSALSSTNTGGPSCSNKVNTRPASHQIDYLNIQSKVDCWKNKNKNNRGTTTTKTKKTSSFLERRNGTEGTRSLRGLRARGLKNGIKAIESKIGTRSDANSVKTESSIIGKGRTLVFKQKSKFRAILGAKKNTESVKNNSNNSKQLVPVGVGIEQKASTLTSNSFIEGHKSKTPDPYVSVGQRRRVGADKDLTKHFDSERLDMFNSPLGFLKKYKKPNNKQLISTSSPNNLSNDFNKINNL